MAKLNAKLYVKAAGEAAVACDLYSTTEEVGGEYVTVTAFGIKAYAKLGGTSDAFATKGMVKKGVNTYAILSQAKPPYNKVEYRTPGTYTFTLPAGVTTAKVTVAGAGGGGGAGRVNAGDNTDTSYTGGVGGRGGLVTTTVTITGAQTVSVIVGAGGGGGTKNIDKYAVGASGTDGGTSSVLGVSAQGGGGGKAAIYGFGDYRGQSYGNGGVGGAGGKGHESGKAGSPGWVIIEYGGDI